MLIRAAGRRTPHRTRAGRAPKRRKLWNYDLVGRLPTHTPPPFGGHGRRGPEPDPHSRTPTRPSTLHLPFDRGWYHTPYQAHNRNPDRQRRRDRPIRSVFGHAPLMPSFVVCNICCVDTFTIVKSNIDAHTRLQIWLLRSAGRGARRVSISIRTLLAAQRERLYRRAEHLLSSRTLSSSAATASAP